MGSTIYPNIDQATLDGMSLHDTLIYPANDGGGIAYHGRITKVPNGWLYGHEFVPDTLCCTGADSFFYYDQTGSNAPVAPTTPTTTPPVIADGALLVELWDDLSRYWKYDADTSSWSYDDIASGGLASVSTDATITGNGTPGSPLSVDKTGDWTGTFDGQEGSYYLDYTNLSNKPTIPTASDLPFGIGWNGNTDVPTKNAVYDKLVTLTAADITDFDTEVSNNVDVAANTAARHTHANKALLDTYTQTEADLADAVAKKHDAVTVLDSAEIDFTLVGQQITGSLKAGSIDETKLDVSVNASLDLADSALQNVVEDLTPQLGGDLDAQNNEITNIDGLSFNLTPVTTGGTGEIWWNPDEATFNMGVNSSVELQVGQENLVYIKADENISNGEVVMYTGAVGASGKPTGALSDGFTHDSYILGIATEDILAGNFGFVTKFGKVRGIQTDGANYGETWNDGDELWDDPTTPGALTNVKPAAPNHAIRIGFVIVAHATNGTIYVSVDHGNDLENLHDVDISGQSDKDGLLWNNTAGYWENRPITGSDISITPFDAVTSTDLQSVLEEIYGDLVIESGFANRTDSTLSFDDGTRTFTITPVGGSFDIWVQNQKYTKSSPESLVISTDEGLHYIYYDNTGTLTQTLTFTPAIITDFTFVCFVYWDSTNSKHIFFGDERHGRTMDSSTHAYLHNILSTRYDSGLQPGNIIADGAGDLDAHIQCSISDGVIRDEDIRIDITDGSPQSLDPILNVPFYYRSGAAGSWRQVPAANYLATTTGTGRAAWNEWTGATWQLSEVDNNQFTLTHLIATNDVTHPIIAIMGQSDYNSVTDARAGALTEISNLAYGPLEDALPEYKPICTFIVQTSNSYTNAVKSRIRTTDEGDDFIDWRSSDFNPIGGSGSSDHGNLTGLGDDDHLQYHNDTRGDARYYTQALLDGGQLDTRYYTETETDTLLLGKSNVGHTHSASDITDFDTEVSNNVDVAANTAARHDAVTVLDSSEIDFTLAGQQITASIINGSIVFSKLQNISTNHLIGRHTAGSGSPEQIQIDGGLNLSGATLRRSALTGAITASEGSNSTSLGSFTKAQLDTAISDGNAVYSGDNVSVLTNDANYAAYTPDGGIALTGQFEQEIVDHGSKAAGFSVDCNAGNIHELIVTASISVTLTNLVPGVVHTFVVFSSGGSYNLSFAPSSGSSYRDYSTTMNTNAFYVYRIVAVSSTNIFVSRTGPYA